jgi:ArsR family transcriptional regulator
MMNDNYALMFKALSDENRLKIYELLIDGETCGCTLIDKLTIKQPTLSYHLKTLADSGLTTTTKEGVWVKHHVDKQKIDDMIEYLVQLKNRKATCDL